MTIFFFKKILKNKLMTILAVTIIGITLLFSSVAQSLSDDA